MSYEGVSHHWTTPAFEDDSNMDVTLDLGGNEENSFLRPIPRSMMDGGDSARTFEDEDMIDLSPRPFLRQDMDGDDQVPDTLDLDQQETAQEPQPEAHDTNGSANDLDEITYDDDEENDDATPSGLDTAPTGTTDQDQNHDGPTDNITGDHPTQEEDREPDLIDYGDDDESEIPQVEATADDADPGENEYFDQHGNSHAENYPEAEVTHDGGADLNDAAHATVEHKESEEFQYHDSTYDNDGNHPSTQHTERSHHTEEQHQKYSSHPIIVDYYNQWISLFKGSISEVQDSFNIEEEVLYGNISLTFERMRQSSFVNIREWECLEVHVPALDLWIRERSDESDRYSFADLLNTYLDLHSRDGNYAPDPLFLTLSVRPIFRHQLEKLQGVAGSGGGFSKCDFLRSSQPNYDVSDGDSGESGEDNEQHSQQYEAHEERDDPAQSAISTVSPHPADPSSATLTGQSNTPGELLTGEGEPSSREDLEAESDEDELGEQQYGHDAYDKNAFDGETYEEDGHEDDQHFNQEYDESAENQENSESLDPFQGNDQEYHQYEDETDQPAEDGGLEIYEGDHQDLEHGYNHDAEEQTADQTYEASKSDREPDRHGFENASTGQDGNDGLAYEDEGQEYLAAYDQSADHQYYDQEETFIGDDIAQEGFAEYDQSLHHESHDQIEGQYQSYGDHGQNGDLGGDHIDGSEAVEAEFLIDYSDTEEVPPQADGVEHALEKDQVNTKEDDISYSDDEDVSGKTPIKRPRADDDLEIEPKRLKAEAT